MQPNEKPSTPPAAPTHASQHKKGANGPMQPSPAAETLSKSDVATVAATEDAGKTRRKKMTSEEKEKLRTNLRVLFKVYDEKEAAYEAVQKTILDAKRARSKAIEEIAKASPDRKSFERDGRVYILMFREDTTEGSPTFGETFYFFRKPGSSEPFEI